MVEARQSERIRDAERTRAELLEVATEVFAEQGLSGARVDEIAERTRTTKRMIYYYFGGKEQLYRAVLEAAYRGIREAEQSIHAADLPPVEAVRRIAELTFDHHHAHPASARHGLAWYEFDPTWLQIRFLEKLGIVSNVRMAKINTVIEPEAKAA